MMPHLLAQKAKQHQIRVTDKEQWRKLVKCVRSEVKERYASASPSELWSDLTFKRATNKNSESVTKPITEQKPISANKPISNCPIEIQDYYSHQEVIESLRWAKSSTKEWISSRRLEKLAKINKYEKAFFETMKKADIKVILKMPYVTSCGCYFTDAYLPKYRLAIEIDGTRNRYVDENKAIEKVQDLKSIGVKLIRIFNYEACMPDVADKILNLMNKVH